MSSLKDICYKKDGFCTIIFEQGGEVTARRVKKMLDEAKGYDDIEVEIGENVTAIGKKAFYRCYSLTKIDISEGVTKIGKDAFFSCLKLKSVKMPSSLKIIGDGAFSCCVIWNDLLLHIIFYGEKDRF